MIIEYDKIEKIYFLNKEIDDDFNIKVIKTFEKLYLQTIKYKIDFVLTGGLGAVLYYKKIYRKIEDIDLIINEKDIREWFKIFQNNYDFCYENHYELSPAKRLKDFFDKKINSLVFKDNEYQVKIEIIRALESFGSSDLKFKDHLIKVKNPEESFRNKINYKRTKDFEDWEFFRKYLIDSK
jgi:hypothetical protein